MRFHTFLIAASAASLLAAAPALAQTKPDDSKTPAQASKPDDGTLQHTSGTGAAAQKQRAQGGAAFEPQQYGTDWARTHKPMSNNQ
jgi:outer membrane biogenesis lipoprotein LolB